MSYEGSIDIMHDKVQYYTGNTLADQAKNIPLDEQEIQARRDDHGNYVGVKAEERVHYHKSLLAGQNTANMCIARLLMRGLASSNHPRPTTSDDTNVTHNNTTTHQDKYNPDEFLEQFVLYMKTPPTTNQEEEEDTSQAQFHNDTYLDVYVRSFFKEASFGVPLRQCAKNQRDSWSVGSLDGVAMVIPIIAAYASEPECMVMGRAVEQHMLTHRSINVTATLYVLVPLLLELFHSDSDGTDDSGVGGDGVGGRLRTVLDRAMDKMRPPAITGRAMCDSYVQHRGPGNIPKQDKWLQHMTTSDESMKDFIHRMVQEYDNDEDVAGWGDRPASQLSTACYCEQAFAVVLYLAYKYANDPPHTALLQNVMLGGHSTSRGAVLGAILGAAHGTTLNFPFVQDLCAYHYIVKEIQDLVDTV
jgi:ADP-ribosyl-[dinitrogen reductase] hydrolase